MNDRLIWVGTVLVTTALTTGYAAWHDLAWAAVWFLGVGLAALTIRPDVEDHIDTERSTCYDDTTPVRRSRRRKDEGMTR